MTRKLTALLLPLALLPGCFLQATIDLIDVVTPSWAMGSEVSQAWWTDGPGGGGELVLVGEGGRMSTEEPRDRQIALRFAVPAEGWPEELEPHEVTPRSGFAPATTARAVPLRELGWSARERELAGEGLLDALTLAGLARQVRDEGGWPADPVCIVDGTYLVQGERVMRLDPVHFERQPLLLLLAPAYLGLTIAAGVVDFCLLPAYGLYLAAGYDPVTGEPADVRWEGDGITWSPAERRGIPRYSSVRR